MKRAKARAVDREDLAILPVMEPSSKGQGGPFHLEGTSRGMLLKRIIINHVPLDAG